MDFQDVLKENSMAVKCKNKNNYLLKNKNGDLYNLMYYTTPQTFFNANNMLVGSTVCVAPLKRMLPKIIYSIYEEPFSYIIVEHIPYDLNSLILSPENEYNSPFLPFINDNKRCWIKIKYVFDFLVYFICEVITCLIHMENEGYVYNNVIEEKSIRIDSRMNIRFVNFTDINYIGYGVSKYRLYRSVVDLFYEKIKLLVNVPIGTICTHETLIKMLYSMSNSSKINHKILNVDIMLRRLDYFLTTDRVKEFKVGTIESIIRDFKKSIRV